LADQNFRIKRGLEVGVGGTVLLTDSNGNLGIGTTNPNVKLQINGVLGFGTAYDEVTYTNIRIGDETTGSGGLNNIFMGIGAGNSNITGNNNNFLGLCAGFSNTTGCHNNFFGFYGGCTPTAGDNNIAIGCNVQLPDTTGSNQLAIGVGNSSWINGDSNFNVGIGTTNPEEKLDVNGNIAINQTMVVGSATSSLSTIVSTPIHIGLSTTIYRSIEYNIQASEGTNFHATKILAIHDGTTAYHSEYGTIFNNSSVASFDVDISGENIRLVAVGATSDQTNYVINFSATKI